MAMVELERPPLTASSRIMALLLVKEIASQALSTLKMMGPF